MFVCAHRSMASAREAALVICLLAAVATLQGVQAGAGESLLYLAYSNSLVLSST